MDPITQALFYQRFIDGKFTMPMLQQLLMTIQSQQERIQQLQHDLSTTLAINVEQTQIQKRNEGEIQRLKLLLAILTKANLNAAYGKMYQDTDSTLSAKA